MNIEEASEAVFPFPKKSHYISILKYLTAEGPSNAPTLREFSNKAAETELKKDAFREGILRGTKKVPGLVKTDYIFEKAARRRYDTSEYHYYLKPKGIIASLQVKKIQENHFFKKLGESIDNKTKGRKFPKLVNGFLSSQIKLFLAYHYLQGIQLTWQTNFDSYYWNFFKNMDKGFAIILKDHKQKKILQHLVEDFIVNFSKVIYLTAKVSSRNEKFPCIFDYKLAPNENFDSKNWYYNLIHWTYNYEGIILDTKEKSKLKEIPRKQLFHTYEDWSHLYNRVYHDLERNNVKMKWLPR